MPGWRDIPALVRHSTMAIYEKSFSGDPDGFIRALRVSRDTLAKQGYVYHGAGLAVLQDIRLTVKGWLRNRKHIAEGFYGQQRDMAFARLWKTIEPKIWELDGPGGQQPPKGVQTQQEREGQEEVDIKFDGNLGPVYPPPKK